MIFGFLRCLALFLLGIPVTLLGLPIVALALAFRTEQFGTEKPFTQYPGFWQMVDLPSWARWWSNPADGALGDRRGWWDNYCQENYNKTCRSFYGMWQWLAIRNSANYFSRIVCGVDMARCDVFSVYSGAYLAVLKGIRDDGTVFPLFDFLMPYKDGVHAFEIRIGWKLNFERFTSDMPSERRFKGHVFRIRPRVKM